MKYANCVFPAFMAEGAGPAHTGAQMANITLRNYHRATIMHKRNFKRFRTHKNKFGTGVDVVWGIKPKDKKGPRGGRVYVHAINFDAKRFSPSMAKRWLKEHDYDWINFTVAKVAKPKIVKRPMKRVANMLPGGVTYDYVASIAANPAEAEPVVGPRSLDEAIKLVRKHSTNAYARAYADAAMTSAAQHGTEGLVGQLPYILNNLKGWRGPLARETKKFMKGWLEARTGPRRTSKRRKNSKKNPTLMILSNPAPTEREMSLAKKAYKSFHFNQPKKEERSKVPDGWPQVYVVLGTCDAFTVKSGGKEIKRTFSGTKPSLCCTKDRSDVYIFAKNGSKLGIPSGTAVRVDYTVPPHSGRKKWSRAWYHPHESKPKVHAHKSGKAVRISGPKLRVTPRGIIG